jgi:hypothetical protein
MSGAEVEEVVRESRLVAHTFGLSGGFVSGEGEGWWEKLWGRDEW